MSILTLLVALVVIGVLLWLVTTYVPMAAPIKQVLVAVVVILTVLWVLSAFGLIPELGRVRVPRAR
jgi:hypothetical protein